LYIKIDPKKNRRTFRTLKGKKQFQIVDFGEKYQQKFLTLKGVPIMFIFEHFDYSETSKFSIESPCLMVYA